VKLRCDPDPGKDGESQSGGARMTLQVIQWTTGNVGRRALRAILRHPDLELVGVFAHSPTKVGVDAADLCGHDTPAGIRATDDVDALLAIHPHACSYNPMWPDVDMVCRLLESGVNVCSTAAFITGRSLGEGVLERLRRAAETGRSTMFGTGVNPGFANLFALVSAQICDRIDQIRVLESADASTYEAKDTQESVGFAQPLDTPGLLERTRAGSEVFAEAVAMMADAIGVDLDEVTFDAEYARATADNDLGFMVIPEGTVAGIDGRWRGRVGGRDVIVLNYQWIMGTHVDAPFKLRHGYFVEVDGEPGVRSQFQILPPPDWSEPGYMGLGMIMTAMPAVNAIPAVVAAPPGIATHLTLPLVTAQGFVTG
jgi:2,4-diaminopentanoate dehydrogenase